METSEFLNRLAAEGILVSARGGKLLCKSEHTERLNGYLEEIKDRKQEILAYFAGLEALRGREDAIEPAPAGAAIPLSFSQQLLYVTAMLDPDNAAYNVPIALALHGELDVPALGRAVRALIERQRILRTVYVETQGGPCQQVLPMRDWPLPVDDLSSRPDAAAVLERRLDEEFTRPFDLRNDLMLRARVFRLGPRHHVFSLTLHHIATDQWSVPILIEELKALYLAHGTGRDPGLPALAIQYADYAWWERKPENEARLEAQLVYWKRQLQGLPQVHGLPLDKPRPGRQSFDGETFRRPLDARTMRRLERLARQCNVTPFTLFHAALGALLARWSGDTDIVVGTMVAKRSRHETAPLIGFFVNNLVLRMQVAPGDTYRDLVAQAHRVRLDAFSNQEVPFEKLVAELATGRSPGHAALFQIALLWDETEEADLSLPGLRIEPLARGTTDTKFDLTVNVRNDRGAWSILWEYNTDVFERPTIESMAEAFGVLLEKLVSEPEAPHDRHSLVTRPIELTGLPRPDAGIAGYIHQELERCADSHPDELALVYEYSDITYRELNDRANQLAHELLAHGIRPGERVALFFERSIDMLVAIMGAMKAGACYVPIDPDYPEQRVRFILEDTAPRLVLSQLAVSKRLAGAGVDVRCLDDHEFMSELDARPARNPDPERVGLRPDHLAYIIYTSGSTGRPKGVMIEHRGLLHLRENMQRLAHRAQGWRHVAWNAPYVFDASLQAIVQVGAGCTLHLLSKELRRSPGALAEYLRERNIDEIDVTPGLLRELLPELERVGAFPSILVGGEAVPAALWSALRTRYAGRSAKVLNVYGPTECTVNSTAADICAHEHPTIGKPLQGMAAVVLDTRMNPVPNGMKGELYLAGAGLARGYWNAPELTGKAFVNLPVRGHGDLRFYRTGDLARLRADGTLDYLGRGDTQVKLRGYRIELEEIAHAMRSLEKVKDAICTVRVDEDGEQRLTGYVVPNGRSDESLADQVRARLIEWLPEYMVPNDVLLLKSIPLTPNGKVDFKGLPVPDRGAQPGTREYVPPGNDLEAELQSLWQEFLKIDSIGVTDNFFLLGGHSLLATRLNARVQQRFGVDVVLGAFFVTPTIRQYASLVEEALRQREHRGAIAPRPSVSGGRAPLTCTQQRLMYVHQLGGRGEAYNISLPLQLEGELRLDWLQQAFATAIRRHESLRMRFVASGDEWWQEPGRAEDIKLEIVELPADSPDELAQRVSEEAERPFELTEGAPIRLRLYRLAERRHVLQVTLHHIVADGWSLQVLLHELAESYNGLAAGRPVEPPPLPMQLGDYAIREKGELHGDRLAALREFWRTTLLDLPVTHGLPLDFSRPAEQSTRGGSVRVALDPPTGASLVELGRGSGTTLFVVMAAALMTLLRRWTGERDIVIGTTLANRDRPELASLIGPLFNSVILRSVMAGNPRFVEYLAEVHELWRQALAHSALPFDMLVGERAAGERSVPPLFQICLSVDQEGAAAPELSGVTVTPLASDRLQIKYDLHWSVARSESGLEIELFYCADLFAEATARSLLDAFAHMLRSIADDPRVPVAELPIQSARQAGRGIVASPAGAWRSAGELLHHQLERQAERSAHRLAVRCEERALTFAELNSRCNRLARWLRARASGAQPRAVLLLERSLDTVVAIFAALKAGMPFVPMDPRAPAAYLGRIIDSLPGAIVLTQRSLREKVRESDGRVFCLDDPRLIEELAGLSAANPRTEASEPPASALAYIMYTSGSTGTPKAVGVTHDNLVNYRAGLIERLPLNEGWTEWAWNSPYYFDASSKVYALVGMPCCVHVLTDVVRLSPDAIARYLERHPIDFLDITPSQLTEVLPALARLPVSRMPNLIVGGEAIPENLWRALGDLLRGSGRTAFNMYGPTECTGATLAADILKSARPVLGEPLQGRGYALLDERLEPVAPGMPGEICIWGAGVGAGYVDDPVRTAERFIDLPLPAGPVRRFYRTGDMARLGPDGELLFIGRRDHQVKVNGHRIETGAIECQVLARDDVANAAVLVRETRSGHAHLAAYVLPKAGASIDPTALLEDLRRELPDYMVPATVTLLTSWPTTPSGKLDRKALLALAPAGARDAEAGAGEPETPTEAVLLSLWRELLGHEQVSLEDSFFALGGHSLLLMRLVGRIRDRFGVTLSLPAIIEAASVRGTARLIDGQRNEPAPRLRISPVSREMDLPASFAQQRLWLQAQAGAAGAAYHVVHVLEIEGHLNLDALGRSLEAIVERHESLRTVLEEVDGVPYQRIRPACAVPVAVFDLTAMAQPERDSETERLVEEATSRPFDLGRDLMIRAAVIVHAPDRFTLALTLHHIASDGWSMRILVREISELYGAYVGNRTARLPALPIQYADYAYWQRKHLEGEPCRKLADYWKAQLAGLPAVHSLPLDYPRPAVQTYNGSTWEQAFDADLARELNALAERHGMSLFMVLEAAFATLLARWSRESDIAIGTPVANRDMEHGEDLIGFFVSVLVLRHRIDLGKSFAHVLRDCKATCLDAFAHMAMPFDLLVQELQVPRSLSHSPLFQIMFSLQTGEPESLELEGLRWRASAVERRTAKFDLMLTMVESDGALGAGWEYNTDLFAASTIESLGRSLATLLEAVVRSPEEPVGRLAITPPEQLARIAQWSNSTGCRPVEGDLASLFAAQAARDPGRCAVIEGTRRLSYRDLDRRANRLAHHLVRHGARPGTRVGMSLAQSANAVISMLAIVKAGAAYVPIDPAYPAERKQAMIAAAGLALVIHDGDRDFAEDSTGRALDLRSLAADLASDSAPEEVALQPVGPSAAAYVIFTSGTTGKPKGAQVTHAAVIRLVRQTDYIEIGPADVIAQCAPHTFDAATFEIWGALLNGAAISLVDKYTVLNAAAFAEQLRRDGITTLFLTTALFNQLVDLDAGLFGSLKYLLTGGEAIHVPKVHALLRAGKPRHLLHVYGPTECTTFSLCYEIHAEERAYPIGKPIANTAAIVLDEALQPAAIGQVGELYVGGPGLAQGYVGEPALTAEKFIPNPFADWPECATLYRTGDLTRLRPDGEIEYVGRTDSQVKINGFRIELDEVEHALKSCLGVASATVLVHRESSGERVLVGYWEPTDDASGRRTGRELQAELARKVPEFMVPRELIKVSALPLNANGKIDKACLPRPVFAANEESFADATPEEIAVGRIWQEILRLPRLPRTDASFFALGGSSILIMKLHAVLKQTLGVDVPVPELFKAPTIRAIAARVAAGTLADKKLLKAPAQATYPVSFAQERLWVEYSQGYGSRYNVPIAFRAAADFDVETFLQALAKVAQRHEILRTAYAMESGELRQRVLSEPPDMVVRVPVPEGTLAAANAFVTADVARRLSGALNVDAGEVLKCFWYRLPDGSSHVLINLSHIATDGWSLPLLLNELVDVYQALSAGRSGDPPPPEYQYKDFAFTQRSREAGTQDRESLDYWVAHLAPIRELRPLSTDYDPGTSESRIKATLDFALDRDQSMFVTTQAQESRCTEFMMLLAAYSLALSLHNDADWVSVGTDYAAREYPETQTMQGFFVEQLCLLNRIEVDLPVSRFLEQVAATVLGAYEHSRVPIDRIVGALGLTERSLRHPLFQTKLVYQNFTPTALEERLAALGIEPVDSQTHDAKNELMLTVAPVDGVIQGVWEYDAALFDAATVARLGRNLRVLLDLWAARPRATVNELRRELALRAEGDLDRLRGRFGKRSARRPQHEIR